MRNSRERQEGDWKKRLVGEKVQSEGGRKGDIAKNQKGPRSELSQQDQGWLIAVDVIMQVPVVLLLLKVQSDTSLDGQLPTPYPSTPKSPAPPPTANASSWPKSKGRRHSGRLVPSLRRKEEA